MQRAPTRIHSEKQRAIQRKDGGHRSILE